MPVELIVPKVGESITEVQIAEWLMAVGDKVEKDANLAVIETEKATVELPSPVRGVLTRVIKKRGETAKVGEVIGYVEEGDDAPSEKKEPVAKTSPAAESGATNAPAKSSGQAAFIMPAAKRALEEYDLKPDGIAATGKGNRLLKEDVLRHVQGAGNSGSGAEGKTAPTPAAPPAAAPTSTAPTGNRTGGREEESVPMSLLRRRVAERLVEAQQTAALLTTFNEIDMSAVMELRKRHQDAFLKKYDIKLGFMSFFVRAAIEALKEIPQINAKISDGNIVYHNYFDIGVAIGGGRGLVVPVLRNAELMSLAQIEKTIVDFAKRAQANALKVDELQGGTFTITNGGVYGSLLSTPIVNPPQSGILGMHAIKDRPIALDGQVVIRPMMNVALTYDHRIVDGREAVTFLRRVKESIEDPARILLEV